MEDIDYHSFSRVDYNNFGDSTRAKYCLAQTLLDITRICSPSTFEQEMSAYCARTLFENGFRVEVDQNGNIMARRGYGDELPLLNAHMDTVLGNVPHTSSRPKEVRDLSNELTPEYENLKQEKLQLEIKLNNLKNRKERGEILKLIENISDKMYELRKRVYDLEKTIPPVIILDLDKWRPEEINYYPKHDIIASSGVLKKKSGYKQQIGGDDKAGVGIILCLAKMTDIDFKVLLTVGEEPPYMGRYGIRSIPSSFYNDVLYCMTLDKMNKDILVNKIRDTILCSPTFAKAVMHYANFCGVKLHTETGAAADAWFIAQYCDTINMSTGYYNSHSTEDFIRVDETLKIMCVVETCLNNLGLLFQYSQRPIH